MINMAYKAGVLGVAVLMVAIVGTLMGSWIMSMDVEEEQVTKYDPLADIVGLFDSEQTPTFTEYNPSTNYTGYYTDVSVIDSVKYFDGVDFTGSKPNNYRVNLPPTELVSDTKTLSTHTGETDGLMFYIRGVNNNAIDSKGVDAYFLTVSDLIDSWSYRDYMKVTMKNVDSDIDWDDYSDIESSWVAFVPKSWFTTETLLPTVFFKNPELSVQQIANVDPEYGKMNFRNPTMACQFDRSTDSVQLFYDTDMTNSAGVFLSSDVYVIFGNASSSSDYLGLGTTLNVAAYKYPGATYLDPSAGVVME